MKTLALVLVLLSGLAWGQDRISGGVRLQLDTITMEGSYERPSLAIDFLGVRWGPVLSGRAQVPTPFGSDTAASLAVLAGVGGTINTPGLPWAVQIQILTRASLQVGAPASIGPEIVLVGTYELGAAGAP